MTPPQSRRQSGFRRTQYFSPLCVYTLVFQLFDNQLFRYENSMFIIIEIKLKISPLLQKYLTIFENILK
jgi:hypothetical protein